MSGTKRHQAGQFTLVAAPVCPSDWWSCVPAHHGSVVLLQSRGFDDFAQEAAVAQRVLLPLEALVQQLVVQQKQLVPQGVNLIRGGRTCSGRQKRLLSCALCFI